MEFSFQTFENRMCSPGLFGQAKLRATRSPAITLSTSAGVACSSHSPFTCTAGAPPQAARHSTPFTVNLPSAVVSPGFTPSLRQACSTSSSAPPSAHDSVVHTSISVFPSGLSRNMV